MTATPESLADVTLPWMSEALGVALDQIDVEQIGEGHGFMGQLARVTLRSSDPACPSSVIVKLPTADPGGRFIGEMMRVWEREHCFYRDIAPQMNIRVPRPLVNIADPPCLVLEDLAPATVGDHVTGATLEQAERAIDVLARHHAAWFEHPMLPTLDWMPGLDDPSILTIGSTFEIGWPLFLERYGAELPSRSLRWCEQFVEQIPTWIEGHFDDRDHADPRRLPARQPLLLRRRFGGRHRLAAVHAGAGTDRSRVLLREQPDGRVRDVRTTSR